MVDTTVIPKPRDSGSDGSQISREQQEHLVEANQLAELPIASTIRGIAASNTKAFGSEVASALVAGTFSHLASELQSSKSEISSLRKKIESLAEELSIQKISNATLIERVNAGNQSRTMKNTGITVGTFLVTTSIAFFDSQAIGQGYGYAFLTVGAILVLAGWYAPRNGGEA